jgi:hypothetical protein
MHVFQHRRRHAPINSNSTGMYAGQGDWGEGIALMCETKRNALLSQRGANAGKRMPNAHLIRIAHVERIERNDWKW